MLPCLIATALRLACIYNRCKARQRKRICFVSFFVVFWPSFPPSHSLFVPELHATPKNMLFYQSIRIDVPLHVIYSHVSSTGNIEGDRNYKNVSLKTRKKGYSWLLKLLSCQGWGSVTTHDQRCICCTYDPEVNLWYLLNLKRFYKNITPVLDIFLFSSLELWLLTFMHPIPKKQLLKLFSWRRN